MLGRKTDKEEPIIGEIEIIAEYFTPLAANTPGSLSLRDDAGYIVTQTDTRLIVTMDALVAGVHFFPDDAPEDIAWKALAVNVSDLAAKGARPKSYMLALAMPGAPSRQWLKAFTLGLERVQNIFGIGLLGGDTTATAGPLTIAITAFGELQGIQMPHRDGGKPGQAVYVTGTVGDAALGLKLRRGDATPADWGLDPAQADSLISRYLRPQPRLALAPVLAEQAAATLDISDGLLLDLSRLCLASGVGAKIEASAVPLSEAAEMGLEHCPELLETVLTGGDDYEILAAIAPEREDLFIAAAAKAGVAVKRIGSLTDDGEIRVVGADGGLLPLKASGYEHFSQKAQ